MDAHNTVPKLLTFADLCALLSRSRASIYRDIRNGRLPRPIHIGGHPRFIETEVMETIKKAADARDRGMN